MDIKDMIAEMIRQSIAEQVQAAIADVSSEASIDRKVAETNRQRASQNGAAANSDEDAPRAARKRGRGRSAVGYIVKAYRGRGRRTMPALVPTWSRTWEAIKAAKGPVTAREIEKVTGDKQKTVESSVYQLRSLGLVQSVRLSDDKR
jgi:hypothetical protein